MSWYFKLNFQVYTIDLKMVNIISTQINGLTQIYKIHYNRFFKRNIIAFIIYFIVHHGRNI